MSQTLTTKWWMILIQGVLLIILSVYIFNNPVIVLAGISFWFGMLVLVAGLAAIITWLASSKTERETMSLLWGVLTFAFGFVLVTDLLGAMKTLTVIFGLWCLLSGIFLLTTGWSIAKINSLGWIAVIGGLFCTVAAIMMMMDIGTDAIAVTTLLGLQVLFTGISLVLLSFAKRAIVSHVHEKVAAVS